MVGAFAPGHYTWTHPSGSFPVCLRPNGVFFCPSFQQESTWSVSDANKLHVDWKKYGQYEFAPNGDGLEGSAVGSPEKWRRMTFLRPFSEAEAVVMKGAGGSVWEFQWEKGAFEVELRCDGYNHFHCAQFPEHSHWSFDASSALPKVLINWGKVTSRRAEATSHELTHASDITCSRNVQYGNYELEVDAAAQTMSGSKVGEPANWRKMKLLRPLGADVLHHGHDHGHGHAHAHGSHCDH